MAAMRWRGVGRHRGHVFVRDAPRHVSVRATCAAQAEGKACCAQRRRARGESHRSLFRTECRVVRQYGALLRSGAVERQRRGFSTADALHATASKALVCVLPLTVSAICGCAGDAWRRGRMVCGTTRGPRRGVWSAGDFHLARVGTRLAIRGGSIGRSTACPDTLAEGALWHARGERSGRRPRM